MISSPLGKMLFQFRTFTLGAWSKQTLSSWHMADAEAVTGLLFSSVLGALAYATQTALNGLGLPGKDWEKLAKDKLSEKQILAAGFQRAGASSIIPSIIDTALGLGGQTPVFNTRSTQQPSGGLLQNPTFGLYDSLYGTVRKANKAAFGDDEWTSADYRTASRALNPLHNYPLMIQFINATSGVRPSP